MKTTIFLLFYFLYMTNVFANQSTLAKLINSPTVSSKISVQNITDIRDLLLYGFTDNELAHSICELNHLTINCYQKKKLSLGFSLCTINNWTINCAKEASLGYGICSLKNLPINCDKNGSVRYGICSLKRLPFNCKN